MTPDGLRTLFLFEKLTDEQLEWLAARGGEREFPAGATVLSEGDPAEFFFILLSGTISMSRRVREDDVETVRTDQRGVYMGAMQAYLREGEVDSRYSASVRAISDCAFFVLPAADFGGMIRDWFPMAIHLLEGLFYGMRNAQAVVGERERLTALGALTAGLMHELNNPAAAGCGPRPRCASGSPACGTSSACSPTSGSSRRSSRRSPSSRSRSSSGPRRRRS